MKYGINASEQPAVQRFAVTSDDQLVVFVFSDNHPTDTEDFKREGPCGPRYFMIIGQRLYWICNLSELETVAAIVPELTCRELEDEHWRWVYRV